MRSEDVQSLDVAELFSVRDRTIVVTGGGRGIGAMIAHGLVVAGADVVIAGRKREALEHTVEALSQLGRCEAIQADLATDEGVTAVAEGLAGRPKVHALINNAGAVWAGPVAEYSRSGFEKVLAVNLVAPFRLTQILLPQLMAAATPEDPARVVNVGSTDGLIPPRYETYAYSSSKAGLHMLTRHLADRLRSEGVTVNAIAPGLFPTAMTSLRFRDEEATAEALAEIPVGRAGTTADIASAVIYLCSQASSYLTGVILPVDGGYSSLR